MDPARPIVVPRMNRAKGRSGENAAAEYLVSQGYSIITRNYQSRHGEIDCIARDPAGTLVFFEVKASYRGGFGNPLFRVTRSKQQTMARMAQRYLLDHHLATTPCRFDVIGITNGKIDHLRNAFLV